MNNSLQMFQKMLKVTSIRFTNNNDDLQLALLAHPPQILMVEGQLFICSTTI